MRSLPLSRGLVFYNDQIRSKFHLTVDKLMGLVAAESEDDTFFELGGGNLWGFTPLRYVEGGMGFLSFFLLWIYTDWANHYLEKARSKKRVNSLAADCSDGVLLAEVIESGSRQDITAARFALPTTLSVLSFDHDFVVFSACQKIPDINRKPKTPAQMIPDKQLWRPPPEITQSRIKMTLLSAIFLYDTDEEILTSSPKGGDPVLVCFGSRPEWKSRSVLGTECASSWLFWIRLSDPASSRRGLIRADRSTFS
ncbi:hypothetical protein GEV33_014009 [Tenebrio molitor]|uniref:Uncharacterized protein n=1 Tax=Tenebrio molitor TaxID=7067 RepID=A0A8J6H6J1_TENMO|nr:hypothetical protein GEV33_014009 [Tenebrio molitor]